MFGQFASAYFGFCSAVIQLIVFSDLLLDGVPSAWLDNVIDADRSNGPDPH